MNKNQEIKMEFLINYRRTSFVVVQGQRGILNRGIYWSLELVVQATKVLVGFTTDNQEMQCCTPC